MSDQALIASPEPARAPAVAVDGGERQRCGARAEPTAEPARGAGAARHGSRRLVHVALLVALGAVWILAAAYVAPRMTRGWVPHDEGTVAQSAERYLAGELPHRDFDEPYTGGLTIVHAAAFRVLGHSLASLRTVLFVAFVLWLPVTFYVASRFVPLAAAGAVTLLAAAWSVPTYAASMPSWYNLFLAVAGCAALLRFIETDRRRWLVVAGVCGGLSILVKVVGLYFVAAALLVVVDAERATRHPVTDVDRRQPAGRTFSVLVTAALALLVAGLVALIRSRPTGADMLHFVLPGSAVAGYLAWREWHEGGGGLARVRHMATMVVPLIAGVVVPVAIFLAPYAASHALGSVARGVLVTPAKRLAFATMPLPALGTIMPALALAGVLVATRRLAPRRQAPVAALVLAVLLALVACAGEIPLFYSWLWRAARSAAPLTVLGGVWLLVRDAAIAPRPRRQMLAVLAVTALGSLVQFPFSAPIYFCYAAPLVVLALAAVVRHGVRAPRLVPLAVLAGMCAFAVLRLHPGFIYAMGARFVADRQTETLALDRGGVRVAGADRATYEALVATVRAHAGPSGALYAAPDAPEVGFLAGLRNPTRTIFDFFDEPRDRTARVLDALARRDVRVVAINQRPGFSGPLAPDLAAALAARFPHAETVGWFQVRWKE